MFILPLKIAIICAVPMHCFHGLWHCMLTYLLCTIFSFVALLSVASCNSTALAPLYLANELIILLIFFLVGLLVTFTKENSLVLNLALTFCLTGVGYDGEYSDSCDDYSKASSGGTWSSMYITPKNSTLWLYVVERIMLGSSSVRQVFGRHCLRFDWSGGSHHFQRFIQMNWWHLGEVPRIVLVERK